MNTRHALVKLCDSHSACASIGCYNDDNRTIISLAQTIFARDKISVDKDVLDIISARLGADRQSSRTEIEKLALYCGPGGRLTADDVETLTVDSGTALGDGLIMAILQGDAGLLSRHLIRFREAGTPPVQIIRQLSNFFNGLLRAKLSMKTGLSADSAAARIRPPLHFRIKPIVVRGLSRLPESLFTEVSTRLYQTEIDIKSGYPVDPMVLVGQILLGLCLRTARLF